MRRDEMIKWLGSDDTGLAKELFDEAYRVKTEHVGGRVYLRGIIEFSNICEKNCFYCGIRKANTGLKRFRMSEDEIIEAALTAEKNGYGSIVLQSGERSDIEFVRFVEDLVKGIKEKTGGRLGITLALGEQEAGVFRRWFEAGAHRYLLRIETSNRELYRRLHPGDQSFDLRMACIESLRNIGYQVGTGVMIGLPYQSIGDLADDLLFFQEHDVDMIGMGPYIVHRETPLFDTPGYDPDRNFMLGLKMIALARCFLKDVNIAATTALQALDPSGREKGLRAGANIVMPNITPVRYRGQYQLYEGKPCLDESADACRSCIEKRIVSIGEDIGFGQWGDSPHFKKRASRASG